MNVSLCSRLCLTWYSLLRPASVSLPPRWVRDQAVPRQRPAPSATSGHTGRREVRLGGTAAIKRKEADQVGLIHSTSSGLKISCLHISLRVSSGQEMVLVSLMGFSSLIHWTLSLLGIGVVVGNHAASWQWRSWVHSWGSCTTSPAASLKHPS